MLLLNQCSVEFVDVLFLQPGSFMRQHGASWNLCYWQWHFHRAERKGRCVIFLNYENHVMNLFTLVSLLGYVQFVHWCSGNRFSNLFQWFCFQGSGFLCMQEVSSSSPNFRIAASGTILESDCSHNVVKKLKLVGYPYKIFHNTSFIQVLHRESSGDWDRNSHWSCFVFVEDLPKA